MQPKLSQGQVIKRTRKFDSGATGSWPIGVASKSWMGLDTVWRGQRQRLSLTPRRTSHGPTDDASDKRLSLPELPSPYTAGVL